jgi:hypothetical protein
MTVRSGAFLLPAVIADTGKQAAKRFVEFFTATIRNPHTRRDYAHATGDFFAWCERHGLIPFTPIAPPLPHSERPRGEKGTPGHDTVGGTHSARIVTRRCVHASTMDREYELMTCRAAYPRGHVRICGSRGRVIPRGDPARNHAGINRG